MIPKVFFVDAAYKQLFNTLNFGIRRILCSYWYFKHPNAKADLMKVLEKWRHVPDFELFIDSGAFSAKTKGVEISIGHYCKYIKEVKPTQYAALDVIGDAVGSERNLKIMEQEYGLKPIPCYHLCEDYKHLVHMIKDHDYIALGGMVGASKEKLVSWLDEAWYIIMRDKPELKVHGFGMTTIDILERYPWYSVDSSSMTAAYRFGQISTLDEKGCVKKERLANFIYKYGMETKDQQVFMSQSHKNAIAFVHGAKVFMKQLEAMEERRKGKDFRNLGKRDMLPGFDI